MNERVEDYTGNELLWDDEKLTHLLAWRRVRARSEVGGFNGLLAHDFTNARRAIEDLTLVLPDSAARKP